MQRSSHWRVFVESDREPGARRVLESVVAVLAVEPSDLTLEPYQKGGYVAEFRVEHPPASWAEAVVGVISITQRLGRGWRMFGSVEDDPSGWLVVERSGDCSVPGVSAAEWSLRRDEAG